MANQMERKEEALKRITFLEKNGMKFKGVRESFEKGSVGIFERQNRMFQAVFFDLYLNKGSEDYNKLIAKKEELEKQDLTVYMIQITHFEFGTVASFFYVSANEEEWTYDWDDLKENYSMCYGYNMDDDMCSEYGTIGFVYDKACGGIYRTA